MGFSGKNKIPGDSHSVDCHQVLEELSLSFEFPADGDQGLAGVFVDGFVEGWHMLEKCAKRDERLTGLAGENAPGCGFGFGEV